MSVSSRKKYSIACIDMRERYAMRLSFPPQCTIPIQHVMEELCNMHGCDTRSIYFSIDGETGAEGRVAVLFVNDYLADKVDDIFQISYQNMLFFVNTEIVSSDELYHTMDAIHCKYALCKNFIMIQEFTSAADDRLRMMRERHDRSQAAMQESMKQLNERLIVCGKQLSECRQALKKAKMNEEALAKIQKVSEEMEKLKERLEKAFLLIAEAEALANQKEKEAEEAKSRLEKQSLLKSRHREVLDKAKEDLRKERSSHQQTRETHSKQISGMNRKIQSLEDEIKNKESASSSSSAVAKEQKESSPPRKSKKKKSKKKKKSGSANPIDEEAVLSDDREILLSMAESNRELTKRMTSYASFIDRLVAVSLGAVDSMTTATRKKIKKSPESYILGKFEALQTVCSSIMMKEEVREIVELNEDCKRGPQSTNLTLMNMPEVLGYLRRKAERSYHSGTAGVNLLMNFFNSSVIPTGSMPHPSEWTTEQVGNGADVLGTIPLFVLQHHISYSKFKYSLYDFILRKYATPIGTIVRTATDIVIEEKNDCQSWKAGKHGWDNMIVALQLRVLHRIDLDKHVVAVTKGDVEPSMRLKVDEMVPSMERQGRLKKIVVRFMHDVALHSSGEFCGISNCESASCFTLHSMLRKVAKKRIQNKSSKKLLSSKERQVLIGNIRRIGYSHFDAERILKDMTFIFDQPRMALLRPYVDKTDFAFLGIDTERAFEQIKKEVLSSCDDKNLSENQKALVSAELKVGWHGFPGVPL